MIPGFKKSAFSLNDVMMYLAIGVKHLRLMFLLVTFALCLGLTYYVYARPVYYSKALIEMDRLALPVDSEKIFEDGHPERVVKQMMAPEIVERTARRLGIEGNAKKIFSTHLKKIQPRLRTLNELEIEIWPYSEELARDWPEAMLQEYLNYRDEQRLKYRQRAIASYHQERAQIDQKMDRLLGSQHEFEEEHEMLQTTMLLNELKSIPRQIAENNHQLAIYERYRAQLQDPNVEIIQKLSLLSSLNRDVRGKNDIQVNVGQVIENLGEVNDERASANPANNPSVIVVPSMVAASAEPWEQFEREQRRLRRELEHAEEIFLPAHPTVQRINAQLSNIERSLKLEYEVAESRFLLEHAKLLDQKKALEEKLPAYQAATRKHEQLRKGYAQLQSGELPWAGLYSQVSRQLTGLEFGADKERTLFRFMGLLELRETPVSPHRLKLLIYALMLGCGLAIGVPLLIEYIDNTVSSIEQTETDYQIRALGIIPQISEVTLLKRNGEVPHKEDRHLLENFRVIRTNILFSGTARPPHVIMVASALPQEGKSVVASNLAISFAQLGDQTLLIDADLRRGRLHKVFDSTRAKPGLSNLLMGEVSLEEALRPTHEPNLTFLPYGEHVDGVTELLGSSKFADLMQQVRGRYQRIIIDTPPVLGLSDTAMLQPLVDGTVFVVWGGRTTSRSLQTAVQSLRDNGANFYGFVLNRLDLSSGTNYYKYYYYSYNYYENYQLADKES
jgi:polysaccharide biosynthesis transport protein